MDAYEATRVVFSRIQALDPENAAKIMGLLLIQDHGDQEMIRLAFGPDALLHSVVLSARDDLGLRLLPPPDASPYLLARQSPSPRLLSPSSWAPPPPFSRSHSSNGGSLSGAADDLLSHDDLFSPGKPPTPSPFYGGDLVDDLQHHERLAFLNDPTAAQIGAKSRELFYPDVPGECGSLSGNGDGVFYPYSMGWEASGHHRRSLSFSDLCVGSDAAGSAWKPCLYFARGHCKNGGSCRFLHGLPDDSAADATAAGSEMDAMVEQQYQELVHLRSKSQRLSGAASQLMASAATSPYPLTGTVPLSPSSTKCMNFLLQHQQQQNDTQRAAAAVAAAALMLGGDEAYKFMGRSRIDRSDYAAGMVNPVLRQIYLTFPADSTFQEEDVSNYFSIYGPVQDVRIPYQQKRMFGFVTFVYPETVRLILAKGNPHFVCDARVLVKPYKEKGKVPEKYRRQQQQAGDFSVCTAPTGLDHRDPYELQHLVCGLRRKLEQQQQQQAIELQGRRLMGLQLGSLTSSTASSTPEQLSPDDKSPRPHHHRPYSAAASATAISFSQAADRILDNSSSHGLLHQAPVNAAAATDKEESTDANPHQDSDFHQSFEHNLPDSPFASPTRASPSTAALAAEAEYPLFAATSTLDMAPFKSCYFQMPRFSSGHGAVEM